MPGRRSDALEAAVRALVSRDLSAAALDARLARAGFDSDERQRALKAVRVAGYLDDARFARERAGRLAGRGYGDEAIRADLRAKGVDPELAEAALAALEPERERARLVTARLGGGARTARTLARKGFSEDAMEAALGADVAYKPGGELR